MIGLDHLNPAQQEAVTHQEGPLLVLAGAGSGKTGVITHRIAWLVSDLGVPPWNITAVTFTNKAAAEMRERVEKMMGGDLGGARIGTFHSMCLRILRQDGERIGLKSGFNIYDATDQVSLVRKLLKDEELDEGSAGARAIRAKISRAKNRMESPESLERRAYSPDMKLAARIYRDYDRALRKANAVDFDDILLRTLELFREHPEVLERYAGNCHHLLVDEYQDTNRPQYLLVRALSSIHGNLFVVGDEDQSIYRFRGAEIRNILDFEQDHPGAKLIRLEQNYRSTGTILAAAGAVIENNVNRKGKKLWTENAQGERLTLFEAPDDRAEAVWAVGAVRQMADSCAYEEIAILYRTNAQSRQLEEIFRRDRIPYQVVGSTQFYERKEIKDLLGYLKLAANPADDVSFRRVVNTPPRGVGNTTLSLVEDIARSLNVPMLEAAREALQHGYLKSRAATAVRGFLDLADWMIANGPELPVAELMDGVVHRAGFEAYMEKAHPGQGIERMENLRSLVSAAAEYADEEDDPTLIGFLDRSALVSDADDVGSRPGVSLMTIHCAKGLEFDTVFMVGLEENIFPHSRSVGMDEDVEEERRLCYVAMTRARKRLLLSRAGLRRFQGTFLPNGPSRFLEEIPEELILKVSPAIQEFRARDRFERSSGSSAASPSARKYPPSGPAPGGSTSPDPVDDDYRTGAAVMHPKFGRGKIIAREGAGKTLKLTIRFDGHGQKKILPSYTSLKVRA
ncbi:MAG: UvrD-helicase domain-containing protein [Acidobacteria bacterium]|uniref:DNA 3'-5' helicase n=1 Tax=Candidatus Polarisedimenticola svalbardensis TaxID=2886004 RepID=A0A8J6Y182_9BACT|nr:UvrD-helicase domain-containing protein [Candidatus Polarisedimenticola svalbardensis]